MTTEERNELVLSHLDLANKIAYSRRKSVPRCVSFDELQSAAYAGLAIAATRYDRSMGDFESFAGFRIRGEICDYLRSLCWDGRQHMAKVTSWDESFDQASEDDSEDFRDVFEEVTTRLTPTCKKIIWLYYAEDKTLNEIGVSLQLSTTRVHQLLQGSLTKMRDCVAIAA